MGWPAPMGATEVNRMSEYTDAEMKMIEEHRASQAEKSDAAGASATRDRFIRDTFPALLQATLLGFCLFGKATGSVIGYATNAARWAAGKINPATLKRSPGKVPQFRANWDTSIPFADNDGEILGNALMTRKHRSTLLGIVDSLLMSLCPGYDMGALNQFGECGDAILAGYLTDAELVSLFKVVQVVQAAGSEEQVKPKASTKADTEAAATAGAKLLDYCGVPKTVIKTAGSGGKTPDVETMVL